jgi:hypothetical protein
VQPCPIAKHPAIRPRRLPACGKIMTIKFEEQFKHRDESKVNALAVKTSVVVQKSSSVARRVRQENFWTETTLESLVSSVLSNSKFAGERAARVVRTSDSGH